MCLSDWSSDVCSSDLNIVLCFGVQNTKVARFSQLENSRLHPKSKRSEERRVGKEWRTPRSPWPRSGRWPVSVVLCGRCVVLPPYVRDAIAIALTAHY